MFNRSFFKYGFAVFILLLITAVFSCTKINIGPDNDTPVVVTPPDLGDKPNIILIVCDDVGYEVPSFNGGQSYQTPALDMMAANGVRFTQAHGAPLSSPSRFMLTTGKYNFRNYLTWGSLNLTQRTIANVLKDNGYATCVAGKWQFDNGDTAIRTFGYDKYCVWDAFKNGETEGTEVGSAYKDPTIYQNGDFLPTTSTAGKYGVDIFTQYVKDFIDSNKAKPFFIYYPIPLAQAPFSPTPDDAAYASWVTSPTNSDTNYYASMVKYMDKSINNIIEKVAAAGIAKNTLILFVSDNGTPTQIKSRYKGTTIAGAMGSTIEYGTHVPMLAYCPGSVPSGVSKSVIDFTDFFATITDLANISVPTSYGTTDGVSFRSQLFSPTVKGRTWIYNYFVPHPDTDPYNRREYVQDTLYKYYDDGNRMFNIYTDIFETKPLVAGTLSETEQRTGVAFRKIIDSIHP